MKFLKNVLRNWKTTTLGLSALAILAVEVSNNPTKLLEPETLSAIALAAAAVAGKDGDKTGNVEGGDEREQ